MRRREDAHAAPLVAHADRQNADPLCHPVHPWAKAHTLEMAKRGPVQLGGSFVLTFVDRQVPGKNPLPRARDQGSFVSSSGAASANNSAAPA